MEFFKKTTQLVVCAFVFLALAARVMNWATGRDAISAFDVQRGGTAFLYAWVCIALAPKIAVWSALRKYGASA